MNAPNDGTLFKRFPLSALAIRHPTVVLVLAAVIVITGIGSYLRVPKESMPEIVIPNLIVNTVYPGVAPKDIEALITRPIEEELNTITDIKTIMSVSSEGYSSINVEFNAGVDMTDALQRVREKVDIAKPKLPSAAEEPGIFEINFSQFPIMQVNVSGDYSLVRLRDVAEELRERLEEIPTVLEVQLAGGLEREVQVDVDLAKLKYFNVSFEDISKAIRQENVTTPGGSIDVGAVKYLVRVPGEFEDTRPIADIVIKTVGGAPVYIRDVANVDFGFRERDSYARLNDNPVVSLAITKRSGENIIETADAVRAVIASAERTFPPGTAVHITSDQSKDIRDMVLSLENNIISGLILVVAVLLFFLGLRTASFVGLAIPMSMLLSFSVMELTGITMNMVVLFSLILALGMLVDNAIVVVENIYRFREQGYDSIEAATHGTAEVATPIIAATATTLAAFFPMAFWPGIVGEFMRFLPLTLIITLSSSLFVALVIIPAVCSLFLVPENVPREPLTPAARRALIGGAILFVAVTATRNPLTAGLVVVAAAVVFAFHHFLAVPAGRWFMRHGLPAVMAHYERVLGWALGHRAVMVGASGAALVAAAVLFGAFNAGVEFFPENIPPRTVYVQVETPVGTRLDNSDSVVRGLERELKTLAGREDIESAVATVGSKVSMDFSSTTGSHLASVAVNFVEYKQRTTDGFATLELMRQTLASDVAGATVVVEKADDGPPTGLPVSIEIRGVDPDTLRRLGNDVVRLLEQSPAYRKLEGLESDLAVGRSELVIDVDRERAALYGLNTQDIGMTVRSAINGTEASTYRDGKDEYDITVRLASEWREDLSALGELTVVTEDGAQVPLSSVATLQIGRGFGDIKRKDLDRTVNVTSDVRAGFNANAVLAEVKDIVAELEASLPPGYYLRYSGQEQEQAAAQAFLSGAFVMAILLIGFILVAQFDSVTKPAIILSSVVLSTIGVLLGLILFRMPFGIIMTGVGVISLAGVVVNNAIVLIDYIDVLRTRDGLSRQEAIVKAGMTRFRPVILTAITTVLGLVPLAVGMNFDFVGLFTQLQPDFYWGGEQAAWWGPMAIAVIAGLTFATFLTLVLVPVMYSLFDDLDLAMRRVFLGARPAHTAPATLAEAGAPPA